MFLTFCEIEGVNLRCFLTFLKIGGVNSFNFLTFHEKGGVKCPVIPYIKQKSENRGQAWKRLNIRTSRPG